MGSSNAGILDVPLHQAVAARIVDASAGAVRLAGLHPREGGNPGIGVSPRLLKEERERMRDIRVQLARPVVVLNGYHGWSGLVYSLRDHLAALTSGRANDFVVVSYGTLGDVPRITRRILDCVAARLGIDAGAVTSPELDAAGISMGGVLSRWCALSGSARRCVAARTPGLGKGEVCGPRLSIQRAFTFASPHRGAIMADRIAPDAAARALKPDSAWLRGLDEHAAEFPVDVTAYALLKDGIVGATRTAPWGTHPIWMRGPAMFAHFAAARWEAFLIDTARRLRGETPLLGAGAASEPPHD